MKAEKRRMIEELGGTYDSESDTDGGVHCDAGGRE